MYSKYALAAAQRSERLHDNIFSHLRLLFSMRTLAIACVIRNWRRRLGASRCRPERPVSCPLHRLAGLANRAEDQRDILIVCGPAGFVHWGFGNLFVSGL